MSAELLTANTLADELGISGNCITRAIHRKAITPSFTAGRTLLFYPRRVPHIRAALGLTSPATGGHK